MGPATASPPLGRPLTLLDGVFAEDGYHIWLLFHEPGARTADLHLVLSTLVARLKATDVFPSKPRGRGGAIFLPCFGGAPLLDSDLHPVDLSIIEPDDPAIIGGLAADERAHRGPTWPPPFWPTSSIGVGVFQDERVFIGPDGLRHARKGARNKIAGSAAKMIIRRGGNFNDFAAWDAHNKPPLAHDKPRGLEKWWRWAQKSVNRQSNGGRSR